jgi:hemoglobin/transferrin/lactoferrin receptor protein
VLEKMNVIKKTMVAVLIASALGNSYIVYADEVENEASEETTTLETLKVLGTSEKGFNVAMTDEMIEKTQASSLQDLFRHEPSITVGGGLPVAQKVYVRGLEDTLLNVTIDGATQAGYIYHHQGRINVEPELIKEIVVKAGAGNATDGAGALGGAIHIKLKDAKDMVRDGQRAGALVKTAFHSNSDLWKNHISAYGMLTDDFGVLASFTKSDANDNYEDGNGDEVDYTELDQESVRIKLSGDIADDHYLSLSYEEYDDDGTRYARANMGELFHPIYPNMPVPQETHRESWVANYGYNPDNALIDLSTTAYFNDSYLTKKGDEWVILPLIGPPPNWNYQDYYDGQRRGGGVESTGLDIRNTSIIGEHNVTYGAEYREDEAYFKNSIIDLDDEETEVFAVYAQTELTLNERLGLSTGLRYDSYDYEDNTGYEIDDDKFSPNATLSFAATPQLELHAGYAMAFKGVSSPEAWFLEFPHIPSGLNSYRGADTVSDGSGVGELKAEESDNIEIGFKYEGANFAASGEIFKQTIENSQVISAGTATRYSYLDDVESTGYALRAAYFWDEITANIGVSETEPELGNDPLASGAMGLGTAYGRTWTTGLEYSPLFNLTMGWNARFVEKLDFVPDGQDDKAGYGVHDVYVQWAPSDRMKLGLAVSNLFDKHYYDQGTFYTRDDTSEDPYGLAEPGRDIRVSFSYEF